MIKDFLYMHPAKLIILKSRMESVYHPRYIKIGIKGYRWPQTHCNLSGHLHSKLSNRKKITAR